MIKIKYNSSNVFEEVTFSRLSNNIVSLKGTTENNTGFTTYKMSGEKLGDLSDFTTTYRIIGDEVQYSNDGSVWVDNKHNEQTEPAEPTWQESIEAQVLYTAMMTNTLIEGE